MASPQSQELTTLYRGWTAKMAAEPEMGLVEMRRMFDHWGDATAEPGGVDFQEVSAGGVPAMWAVPKGAAADTVLLCTHGGGYIVGSMYSHRKLFAHMAKSIGCWALILNYRCAPEHPHPAPVEDAATAYRWLLSQGIDPGRIVLAGDSAGGALAVAAALKIAHLDLPRPAAIVAMSPWVDMEVSGGTVVSNADRDALVSFDVANGMAETFLGPDGDRRDPLANPLFAELRGLPPLFIQVGGDEILLDDSLRLAEHAKASGVEVELEVVPAMQHVFQFLVGTAPEGDAAIASIAAWVRQHLPR